MIGKIVSDRKILKDREFTFVDMHHHSNVSDGSYSPGFIAKAAAKRGFGVCIADHNRIKGSLQISKEKGIFTIPAIEITTKQSKDVLAYFRTASDLKEFWEKEIKNSVRDNRLWNLHSTTIDTVELFGIIKDYNGFVSIPHPLTLRPKSFAKMIHDKNIIKKVDAIESHNYVLGRYKKTLEILEGIEKPLTAGSDSHLISKFNVMVGAKADTPESFLDEILKGRSIVYAENPNFFRKLHEQLTILKNNLTLRKHD